MAIREFLLTGVVIMTAAGFAVACPQEDPRDVASRAAPTVEDRSPPTIEEGKRVFRFETFGDEEFWTDKARRHEVAERSVSPAMALKLGLKVDVEAIPPDVAAAIKCGEIDLQSPDTSLALLKPDAVVGLKGTVTRVPISSSS